MNDFMVKLFGASWRTTVFGIIQFVAGLAYNYMQSLAPGASWDWKIFFGNVIVAVLAMIAKDGKVHGGTIASGEVPTKKDTREATAAVAEKAKS